MNTTWVIVAGVLVMFMQAGFLFLEVGFSREKNAGIGVAKILTNFSIASIAYWAVGFALAFGGAGTIAGDARLLPGRRLDAGEAAQQFPLLGDVGISPAALLFFQFVFCAVSLAIVWGTTLERIKFSAYVIYAVVFCAVIYPILSHWIFGGGWLQVNVGMQDFAGSTVVHLIGATGGSRRCCCSARASGKYGPDGKPRAIPGHSMPLVGLGVLILWLGWFGFNPGSTLGAIGNRFAEVVLVTNLAAAAGVIAAVATIYAIQKTFDIGMAGNGAIAGLVAITAPSGYVEFWAAPIIGAVAGVIVVFGVLAIEKVLDDPVGALSAHGLAGIWGTLSCGMFTVAAAGGAQRGRRRRACGTRGCFHQLGAQALGVGAAFAFVFVVSFAVFCADQGRRSACASRPRRRTPASTSSSTACTATRSSSSRRRRSDPLAGVPAARGAPRSAPLPDRRTSETLGGTARMKKIDAFIRHEAFEPIRMDLLEEGFPSLSISRGGAPGARRASPSTTGARS